MKKILLLPALLPLLLSAQQDSTDNEPQKFIKVISISAYGGGEMYREGFEDRSVFQQAAPNSTLAFADLSGYGTSNGWFIRYGNVNSISGLNVNLRLRGQKFSEVRVGIGHSVTSYSYQSYSKESRTFIGTSTLPGGDVVSTDSVSYASYNYAWYSDVMQLNLAWILRSNPRNWLNVYTGLGVSGGIGYNGVLEYNHIHTSEYRHSTTTGNVHSTTHREVISEANERFRAPVFGFYSAYIPIGVNIRLGRRNTFLSHIALFGEYTGAVQLLTPKGVDSKVRTSSGGYGGVRWYIHAPGGDRNRNKSYKRGDGMVH
jgi:hypothetical protein